MHARFTKDPDIIRKFLTQDHNDMPERYVRRAMVDETRAALALLESVRLANSFTAISNTASLSNE